MEKSLVVKYDEAGQIDKVILLVNGEMVSSYEPEDLESPACDLLLIDDEDYGEIDPEEIADIEVIDGDQVVGLFTNGLSVALPKDDKVIDQITSASAPDDWLTETE